MKKAPQKTSGRIVKKRTANNFNRDHGKYVFNDNKESYGKGPLVHAIMKDFCKKYPWITYDALKKTFPGKLRNQYGIFTDVKIAQKVTDTYKGIPKYFVKPADQIKLVDRTIVVCNQFSLTTIQPFLKHVKTLGYKVKRLPDKK